MAAPDFYFAIQAIFRHIHDRYGKAALVDYWRSLAREYYGRRIEAWKSGGPTQVAADWRAYFDREPGAEVDVLLSENEVRLVVRVCPAIRHLEEQGRQVVPYFCEHCDHICGEMAGRSGFAFERTGGMGSCRQRFTRAARPAGGPG